ncbi:MAG: formylglycine-generating enzyme family protein [Magnetococcus sp. YQC-3]
MRVTAIFSLAILLLSGCASQPETAPGKGSGRTDSSMEFVQLPGGSFEMGCGGWQVDCSDDERPAHKVTLQPFAIGKYEVTQAQWTAVMGRNPSEFVFCGGNCPVERVSWNDVQDFIKKLNANGTAKYRLPTEAEWEYACRSGGYSDRYCGENNPDNVAWFDAKTGNSTGLVGTKGANRLGLYDMSGNVWEWVEDWYCDQFYSSPAAGKENPVCTDPASGLRVLRGGSWFNASREIRSTGRNRNAPSYRNMNIGFRLVRRP